MRNDPPTFRSIPHGAGSVAYVLPQEPVAVEWDPDAIPRHISTEVNHAPVRELRLPTYREKERATWMLNHARHRMVRYWRSRCHFLAKTTQGGQVIWLALGRKSKRHQLKKKIDRHIRIHRKRIAAAEVENQCAQSLPSWVQFHAAYAPETHTYFTSRDLAPWEVVEVRILFEGAQS